MCYTKCEISKKGVPLKGGYGIQSFHYFRVSRAAWFCDREAETARLKKHVQAGSHVTLFAIRRLGKTGLVQHFFEGYKGSRSPVCIYLDIFATQNLREFSTIWRQDCTTYY